MPGPLRVGWIRTVAVSGICLMAAVACSTAPGHRPEPATAPGTTTPASSRMKAPGKPGYLAAKHEWLAEGRVWSSADQAGPLQIADADLRHGEMTDAGNTSEYPTIISAIRNLARLPDAMDTPAQDARAAYDVEKVDKFFRLRVARGCNWPSALRASWAPAADYG